MRLQVVYLPHNLDLSALFSARPHLIVYYQWVVSTLYLHRRMRWDSAATYGAPLHWAVLRDILPQRERTVIIRGLVAAGVVRLVRKHRAGVSARQYRLAPRFENAPYVAVPVTHPGLLAKLQRHRERVDAPHWDALQRHFDRLDIDPAHTADNLALAVLQNNPLQWFVRDQNGRLHTPLTALDRVYRRFVTVAGKRLVQADISHCQPLLLAALLLKRDTPGPELNDELNEYTRLCAGAKLYDLLADLTGLTRDRAKKQFLAAVYDHPRNLFRYKAGRAFAARFPRIWAEVVRMAGAPRWTKRKGRSVLAGNGDLAKALQRLESDIVVRLTAGRLADEFPAMPFYTVHDCVVTAPDDAERASAVLRAVFLQETGIDPTVKVSEWSTTEVPETRESMRSYLVMYVRTRQGDAGCALTGQRVAELLGLASRQAGKRMLARLVKASRLVEVVKGKGRRPGVYRAGGINGAPVLGCLPQKGVEDREKREEGNTTPFMPLHGETQTPCPVLTVVCRAGGWARGLRELAREAGVSVRQAASALAGAVADGRLTATKGSGRRAAVYGLPGPAPFGASG